MKSVLLVKKFLQLVEMTSGLVNASFSFPEWQAVNKNDCLCTLAHPDCSTIYEDFNFWETYHEHAYVYSACRCVETFETIDVYLMLRVLFFKDICETLFYNSVGSND